MNRTALVVGFYGAGLAAVLGAAAAAPRDGEHVLVAASPFAEAGTAERIVAAAGGSLVAGTRFGFAAVAESRRRDFVAALYGAGAVLVLDAGGAAGCSGKQWEARSWN